MIKIDKLQIQKLEKELDKFTKRALPFATRNTLNKVGFTAQKIARENVKGSLINRNTFTVQSIRVNQTKSLDISEQQVSVGSTADYMEVQEFGGTKSKKGKKGIPIPTSYSAGLPQNTIPRTKLTTRSNKIENIRLTKRRNNNQSRKQRNFVAIQEAAENKRRFVYLDLGQRQGIFKVIGGKKKPKIKMIYDLSNQSLRIPRKPWLFPSIDQTIPFITEIHIKSLQFQVNREKLFRNK